MGNSGKMSGGRAVAHFLSGGVATLFVVAIKAYQMVISPLLPGSCRYHPTCSNYAIQAINEWGILKGACLSVRRIAKCHPCGGWGEDHPPKK